MLYTVATGLFQGRRASVFAALGCTFGIVPTLIASIMGLGIIIHTSALAFQVVKYVGAAYLLYLAWSMLQSSGSLVLNDAKEKKGLLGVATQGFLINILNPKLSIFFLAFLPQFVPQNDQDPTRSMLVLGAVFMAITFSAFVVYGLLANRVRDYIVHSEKGSAIIQRVFAGSFAVMGLKLALSEHN